MEARRLIGCIDSAPTRMMPQTQDEAVPPGPAEILVRDGGTEHGTASAGNRGGDEVSTLDTRIDALNLRDDHGNVLPTKEHKQSTAVAAEIPPLLQGWRLESEAEYARRIGKDLREVKEEMLRDFEESLAVSAPSFKPGRAAENRLFVVPKNKPNTLPGGYQLPIVFRPPSPVSQPRDSQIPAIATGDHGVEQCRSAEGNEDDDYESVSDDESEDLEYYEISPREDQGDIDGTERRGRVQTPRRSIANKQGISPLPTPESGYLADRTVSREWMATFDVDADTTLPSLTTYIRILEACEARRR
ncbi:hypothetical protein GLOTRDRAFT_133238 [Gloeophyllum trabeum ATCC 11539]|uniref:Uncharacterized protein n=1 Tax=Gloeophyllum trabeum (strain ATCC 11539 / FP-39264 / Madison 617) TaxID=670483 RepID=S7PV36_GLOTA|nr:uncharacterized protein GLOTRDRAFT_133238 [Gloeophyllum trabeum ATCC 11539]EPQ51373.1 hypothetical protein GLOTRDRAFT_133238 [Gloeophyllum trabeum ATCC 11539]